MIADAKSEFFLRKIKSGFQRAKEAGDRKIICAVSGGTDSVALLLATTRLLESVDVAHFNHKTRCQESDDDEDFVRQLCSELGVTLRVGSAPRPSSDLGEDRARSLRYEFLAGAADEIGADAIAVAHTIEDQAETVLLRLARGSGVKGAGAMRPRRSILTPRGRSVGIVRPMLQVARAEASEFLRSQRIEPRHDPTNDDWVRYSRNRVRHRVIPELQAINPNASHAIARFASIMQSHDELVDDLARRALTEAKTDVPNSYDRVSIAGLHPVIAGAALITMHQAVARRHTQLEETHVRKLIELMASGKSAQYALPEGVNFETDHRHVSMKLTEAPQIDRVPYPGRLTPRNLQLPGTTDLGDGYKIEATYETSPSSFESKRLDEAWVGSSILGFAYLVVRNPVSGDCFNPLGMTDDVELSRFLIKSKIPASHRSRIPVVATPESNRIVWLPGIRLADWAKVDQPGSDAVRLRLISGGTDRRSV